jgi:DNA polymerase-1
LTGLEADDVMGILATKPGKDKKIIVSRDKDMRTIPAMVWDGTRFFNITQEQADYQHLLQTLTGDASDGYKGCPGIGPKKAEKLLDAGPKCVNGHDACNTGCDRDRCPYCEKPNLWLSVVSAYEKAGLTEADALRQARLARILRWSDWDSETKQPKLWTPNA